MKPASAVATALLSLASTNVLALQVAPLPEPGVLELLSIAAIAGLVITIRNRRK